MYSILQNGGIKRVSDGAIIPVSDSNYDYLEYLAWVDAGGVAINEQDYQIPKIDALSSLKEQLMLKKAKELGGIDHTSMLFDMFSSIQERKTVATELVSYMDALSVKIDDLLSSSISLEDSLNQLKLV